MQLIQDCVLRQVLVYVMLIFHVLLSELILIFIFLQHVAIPVPPTPKSLHKCRSTLLCKL
jgi:hypothetical protein